MARTVEKKTLPTFFPVKIALCSGERSGVVPLSARLGARVAPRSAAAHTQNAPHARAPGPQQDAQVLPRDEGEQHRGRTGEHAVHSPVTLSLLTMKTVVIMQKNCFHT